MKTTSKDGLVLEHSSKPPWAVLSDFDIDGKTLKKHHTDWLDDVLLPAVKVKPSTKGFWHVDLRGRASSSGTNAHNHALSMNRIDAVRSYTLSRGLFPATVDFLPLPLGEGDPRDPAKFENQLDRSVEVEARFFPTPKPKPKPPRKIRLRLRRYNVWKRKTGKVKKFNLLVIQAKISLVGMAVDLGPVKAAPSVGKVRMFIEIEEQGTSDKAQFEFSGPAALAGIIGVSPKGKLGLSPADLSKTFEGGENTFTTETAMDADDFDEVKATLIKTAVGATFIIGTEKGIFAPSSKIPDFDLGKTSPGKSLQAAECTVNAEMELVASAPSWVE